MADVRIPIHLDLGDLGKLADVRREVEQTRRAAQEHQSQRDLFERRMAERDRARRQPGPSSGADRMAGYTYTPTMTLSDFLAANPTPPVPPLRALPTTPVSPRMAGYTYRQNMRLSDFVAANAPPGVAVDDDPPPTASV